MSLIIGTAPPFQPPKDLQDSGSIACAPGVYTQLIANTSHKSKWIQVRINNVAADGNLELAIGPAGAEVDLLHWFFSAGTNWDIGNMMFEIPKGVRVSCKPSVAVGSVEYHHYF